MGHRPPRPGVRVVTFYAGVGVGLVIGVVVGVIAMCALVASGRPPQ